MKLPIVLWVVILNGWPFCRTIEPCVIVESTKVILKLLLHMLLPMFLCIGHNSRKPRMYLILAVFLFQPERRRSSRQKKVSFQF